MNFSHSFYTTSRSLYNICRYRCKGPLSLSKFSIKIFVKENLDKVSVVTIKVLIIFVKELERNLVNMNKWLQTLTNYENIAVTLCLMSIAIIRRRFRDRARVRKGGQLYLGFWEGNKEAHTIHFLKNCTLKTRTSSEIILEWTKHNSRCSFRKWDHW